MAERMRPRSRPVIALVLTALALGSVHIDVAAQSAPSSDPSVRAVLGAGGEYHPITPETIVPSSTQVVRPTSRTNVDALALAGVPDTASDVLAVLMQVTVWKSDVDGELVAFSGSLADPPSTSSLTFSAARPTSALVVVRPGSDGTISFRLTPRGAVSGEASMRAVVVGWFSTSTASDRGSRIVTRGMRSVYAGRLSARASSVVQVAGRGGVPTGNDVEAVIVNITARQATENTNVTVAPAAGRVPPTLSVKRRELATATLAVVPLAEDGSIQVRNRAGDVDVAIHVVGFTRTGLDAGSSAGRLVPLSRPYRAVDTTAPPSRPIGPGQAEPWGFSSFVNDLTYSSTGEPVGPVGAVFGAFAAHSHLRQYPLGPVGVTELRVYPDGSPLPPGPNLTISEEQRRSNTVLAGLSAADVLLVHNLFGSTHYRLDVSAVILE